jgi:hypothetical protein
MSVPSGGDRKALRYQAFIGTGTGKTNRSRENMYEM